MTKSETLYRQSTEMSPAGVHSPVRAFQAIGGSPIFFQNGLGSKITDVDDNTYIDFCMCWGALSLGHANKEVVKSIQIQTEKGTHFGTPTPLDVELGKIILSAVKVYDQIRFVNSGTEAVMTALRLARGVTQKNKIVKLSGAYHGHTDSLLVEAGSGLLTQSVSSSKGVTPGTISDTLVIPYDSKEAVIEIFKKYGDDIAAVIIEPIFANSGLFEPSQKYIDFLRKITRDHDSLLIFDEVITGFRVGWQGASKYYNIEPDIGTFGKIIGGGLPVGAICAKKNIMSQLAPLGGIYQAGTLSGNPLCMAAGIATLNEIRSSDFYSYIEDDLGPYLDKKIGDLKTHFPLYYKRVSSIFWICPGQMAPPQSPAHISQEAPKLFKEIYRKILNKGIYLSPSVYEVSFLSRAHTKDDIDQLTEAFKNL